jgi:hypothetical protein
VGQPAAKLSVSVPGELAAEVRRRVGTRGLSGFVARAIAHELERQRLGALLIDLESDLGPVPPAELARVRRQWPRR